LARYVALRSPFLRTEAIGVFFLKCGARETFLIANAALERI